MTDKAVIITGSAGGIGHSLAQEFHECGYRVIAVDKVAQPEALACNHYVQVDLSDTIKDKEISSPVFSQIREYLKGASLNALIHNAAVQHIGSVNDLSISIWKETLDINLLAPFVWTREFLPELERSNGCVLSIGSIHSRLTKPKFVAYATSKAALSCMMRALAVELAGKVRFNIIEPAAIMTEMLKSGFSSNPELLDQLRAYHPTGEIGKPDDLAKLSRMIVEVDSRFFNGAIIEFNGAISSRLHDPI